MRVLITQLLLGILAGSGTMTIAQVDTSDGYGKTKLNEARESAKAHRDVDALQALQDALASGLATSKVLTDPDLLELHELPRFRELIKQYSREHSVDYVPDGEPGKRLRVSGRVLDDDGQPIPHALLYVFQTGTSGTYSSKGGNATMGDSLNPRLFGYVLTNTEGKYAFNTIRPGEYRGGGPPAHIHYHVSADNHHERITEIMFGDDPRLIGRVSGPNADGSIIIVDVEFAEDGSATCTADIVMRRK